MQVLWLAVEPCLRRPYVSSGFFLLIKAAREISLPRIIHENSISTQFQHFQFLDFNPVPRYLRNVSFGLHTP